MNDEQIAKLTELKELAEGGVTSKYLIDKIGSVTIQAGLGEFYSIQLFRALEQVTIKPLMEKGERYEKPKPNEFFYDEKISTRMVLKNIKIITPSKTDVGVESVEKDLAVINAGVKIFLGIMHKFLDKRNLVIHHMGNPKISFGEIESLVVECQGLFNSAIEEHTKIMPILAPYSLTQKQRDEAYS